MSITVFQSAHNFIVSDDTEIYYFIPGKVKSEVAGNFEMISEKERQDVRINH